MRSRVGDPLRAIAYVRVSTDDQHLGPEAQRDSIQKWAAAAGVQVVGWFQDLGLSGGLAPERRPGLLSALQALKVENAGLLIAAKRDRLGRDLIGTAMLERLAERNGGKVVTADGVSSGDRPEDVLMRSMVDAFAMYERLVIKARTRAALAVKRSRGERTGQLPFGYQLGPDGRTLTEQPAEQVVLDRIRALRAAGLPLRAIVEQLNQSGAPCRGRRWHLATVHRLARTA